MYILRINNILSTDVVLDGLSGITVPQNGYIETANFSDQELRNSISLIDHLIGNRVSVTTSFGQTYAGLEAIDVLRGMSAVSQEKGIPKVLVSDKPEAATWMLMACYDDVQNQIYFEGGHLDFELAANSEATDSFKLAQYIDTTYLKGGIVVYQNLPHGSWLEVGLLAPAGIPHPSFSKKGNFDLVGENWTPNMTGTGAYYIRNEDYEFAPLIRKVRLHGSGSISVTSQESFKVDNFYKIKVFTHFAATGDKIASLDLNLEMYRNYTAFD